MDYSSRRTFSREHLAENERDSHSKDGVENDKAGVDGQGSSRRVAAPQSLVAGVHCFKIVTN